MKKHMNMSNYQGYLGKPCIYTTNVRSPYPYPTVSYKFPNNESK